MVDMKKEKNGHIFQVHIVKFQMSYEKKCHLNHWTTLGWPKLLVYDIDLWDDINKMRCNKAQWKREKLMKRTKPVRESKRLG